MPKQITELKEFVTKAKLANWIKLKRSKDAFKFKLRTNKCLYTLVVDDEQKADKLKKHLRTLRGKQDEVKGTKEELKNKDKLKKKDKLIEIL